MAMTRRVKWEEQTYNSTTSAWGTNTGTGAVKKFVWCGTEICQQRDASNGRWKHFYADGEHDVTGIGGGTKRYYTRDHLGSVRETVDENGDVVNQYDYSPYGVREVLVDGGEECLFGFTGHVFDAFSGLHLALYRGYDAELGRWVSRDPIGEAGGLNLYAYVIRNSINFVDLLGLDYNWFNPTSSKDYGNRLMAENYNANNFSFNIAAHGNIWEIADYSSGEKVSYDPESLAKKVASEKEIERKAKDEDYIIVT